MDVLYVPPSLESGCTDLSAMRARAVAARSRNIAMSNALSFVPRFSVTCRLRAPACKATHRSGFPARVKQLLLRRSCEVVDAGAVAEHGNSKPHP